MLKNIYLPALGQAISGGQLVFRPDRAVEAGGRDRSDRNVDIEKKGVLLRAVDVGVAEVAGPREAGQGCLEGYSRRAAWA